MNGNFRNARHAIATMISARRRTQCWGWRPVRCAAGAIRKTGNPKGSAVAVAMRRLMDSLQVSEDTARALVAEAEQRGMEISEAKFKLRDVRQARLEARTIVHAFDEQRFRDVAGKGLAVASNVSGEAQQAIDEYVFRRVGLGIATLIITVVAVSLYMFIRRLEARQRRQTASDNSPIT